MYNNLDFLKEQTNQIVIGCGSEPSAPDDEVRWTHSFQIIEMEDKLISIDVSTDGNYSIGSISEDQLKSRYYHCRFSGIEVSPIQKMKYMMDLDIMSKCSDNQNIDFNYNFDDSPLLDKNTGKLSIKEGCGLTCSTSIYTALKASGSLGIDLVDFSSFLERPGDKLYESKISRGFVQNMSERMAPIRFRPEDLVAGVHVYRSKQMVLKNNGQPYLPIINNIKPSSFSDIKKYSEEVGKSIDSYSYKSDCAQIDLDAVDLECRKEFLTPEYIDKKLQKFK